MGDFIYYDPHDGGGPDESPDHFMELELEALKKKFDAGGFPGENRRHRWQAYQAAVMEVKTRFFPYHPPMSCGTIMFGRGGM